MNGNTSKLLRKSAYDYSSKTGQPRYPVYKEMKTRYKKMTYDERVVFKKFLRENYGKQTS